MAKRRTSISIDEENLDYIKELQNDRESIWRRLSEDRNRESPD